MRRIQSWLLFLVPILLLTACGTGDQTGVPSGDLATLSTHGRYIVVLRDAPSPSDANSVRAEAASFARSLGLSPDYAYGAAISGFAARMPAERAAALARHPRVAYVETDDPVTIFEQQLPTGVRRIFADANAAIGIDGIDDVRVDVDVAVIDTGVDFEHPDLNVIRGVDCTRTSGGGPPWARTSYCSSSEGTGGDDDHYHGTHVAGTIAALDNGVGVVGVAPGARIWAVKVLDRNGSGSEAGVVAGIDWVTQNSGDIEVANMSLGGAGFSQAEYDAIQGAVDAGVAFAVAAGNDGADATGFSPAGFNNVLTVSALADFDGLAGGSGAPTCRTDQDDTLADFSNWGRAVDVAAPGVCILSTFPLEQGEYGTISGTSMASPHVAGALALLASSNPPATNVGVESLYAEVKRTGNFDWSDDSDDGMQEPLLDVTGFVPTLVPGGGETGNSAPTVTISSPTDGASFESGSSISFVGTADDTEDGALTASLAWTTDLTEGIGTGGSFQAVLVDGTHTITAAVTDSDGTSSSSQVSITVGSDPTGSDVTLSITAYKVKGVQHADLTWTGVTSNNVDVYRNGTVVATTVNDGFHTDSTGNKGGGSAVYQVCEAATTTCSATATAVW